TGRARNRHPQTFVVNVALQGEAHEPLAGVVDRSNRLFLSAPPLLTAHRREDAVCLVPRRTLARCNYRANRNVETRHSSKSSSLCTKLCDAFARGGERLSIDRVDIAKSRAHIECTSRGAAKKQERMRLL